MLVDALRHHPHWRIGRTGLLMESLVPAIIEQKVTGKEAFGGFRALVHRYGERAPGPRRPIVGCGCADATTLRAIPSWEWLRMHVDPARSRTLVQAARVAPSLERLVGPATPTPTGGCARCRGSGCGPVPRPGSGRWGTPTR